MGALAHGRRRQLAAKGRSMVLSRLNGASVTLTGFARDYRPEDLTGGIVQGDLRVEILQDEIAASSWPGPPRKGDRLVLDGHTYTLQGAAAVHEGAAVIGHSLWVRG